MPISLTSKLLQGTGVTIFASLAGFTVWTKHIHWEEGLPAEEPLFQSTFYRRSNPSSNPALYDVAVRKFPISKLNLELVQDAQLGGTRLVEHYCAGVWGSLGYATQRQYLKSKYQNNANKSTQLWTRRDQLDSTYPVDTKVSDHFCVLSKTTNFNNLAMPSLPPSEPSNIGSTTLQQSPITQAIVLRCGTSPIPEPSALAPADGLFSLTTILNPTEGYVEFRMQSILWQGTPAIPKDTPEYGTSPMTPAVAWLHRRYVELLMEGAFRNCMR